MKIFRLKGLEVSCWSLDCSSVLFVDSIKLYNFKRPFDHHQRFLGSCCCLCGFTYLSVISHMMMFTKGTC